MFDNECDQSLFHVSYNLLGTGHGVGAALNVHEGPQSISFRYGNITPLQRGMIVSNEPGYYEDHAFGIRIEVHIPTLYATKTLLMPCIFVELWLSILSVFKHFTLKTPGLLFELNAICSRVVNLEYLYI